MTELASVIIGDSPRSEAINHLALVSILVEKGIVSEKEVAEARNQAKRLVDKELKTKAVALRKYYKKRLAELRRISKKADGNLHFAILSHQKAVGNMIKIMEKNYFAALDFRLAPAMIASLGGMLIWFLAIVGPFTGTASGIAAGIGMFSISIPAYALSRRLGWSAACSILTPLIYLCMFYAILRSAWVTTRQGGVSWWGTHYSLSALREGSVK